MTNLKITTREQIIDDLLTLPVSIVQKEKLLMGFTAEINLHQEDIDRIEINMQGTVASETKEENGVTKKAYPNESARAGEVQKRLGSMPEYNKAKKDLENIKKDKILEEARLRYLNNQFIARKYIARLLAGGND